MGSRNLFASSLIVGILTIGSLGIAPLGNAVSAGPLLVKFGKSASSGNSPGASVTEIRYRARGRRIYVPIAPSYRYYDYPYYYSRGYYPISIRPGFVYYGYPYAYYVNRSQRRYRNRCAGRQGRCSVNRGHSRRLGSARRRR